MNDYTKELIDYMWQSIDNLDERMSIAYDTIDRYRCPLSYADPYLYNDIERFMEDYAYDNDLSQEWVDSIDINELFWEL